MRVILGLSVMLGLVVRVAAKKIEAESGTMTGTMIGTEHQGYSGTGYVTGFDEENDAVAISVPVENDGLYMLRIGYSAPYGEKINHVYVNGVFAGSQVFTAQSTFDETGFGKVYLVQGDNEISIVKGWGYFEVDYITVQPAQPNPIHQYSGSLINERATYEANILYQYLRDLYGHRIISGQQTYNGHLLEFNFLKENTGKLPAIQGFDLIDYSPSRVERGTSSQVTERSVEWWQQGGIVSMTWHWNAPKGLLDTDDAPWWSGFYTNATTFDLSIAMNDAASEEYELIIRDIDVIAQELKLMHDENVPLLWRPLHEAEGGWFWWGAKGPETCVWLWKLMYDRLTNYHKLNNLIWVWTGTDSDAALEWYPGDDFVDIVGADIYLDEKNYSSGFSMFDNMAGIHEGKKIVTMSETGTLPDPDLMMAEKARWSWFCTWNGDFILDGVTNELAQINKVYNHEYVITFDELPDFYNYESPEFPDEDPIVPLYVMSPLNNIRVFPNPTPDFLTINFQKARVRQVLIHNLKGDLLYTSPGPGNEDSETVDLRPYASGVYVLQLVVDQEVKRFRIRKL